MEKITLHPGIWTRVYASNCFQSKSNQSGIRIHYGTTAPAVDTDLYFLTQEFDLKPFRLPGIDDGYTGANIYMMPDEDQAVDIVAL
jgi:hypothetical protein